MHFYNLVRFLICNIFILMLSSFGFTQLDRSKIKREAFLQVNYSLSRNNSNKGLKECIGGGIGFKQLSKKDKPWHFVHLMELSYHHYLMDNCSNFSKPITYYDLSIDKILYTNSVGFRFTKSSIYIEGGTSFDLFLYSKVVGQKANAEVERLDYDLGMPFQLGAYFNLGYTFRKEQWSFTVSPEIKWNLIPSLKQSGYSNNFGNPGYIRFLFLVSRNNS